MKQTEDTKTGDLLEGFKRPVGRPLTGRAQTSAERQRKRRELLRASGRDSLTVELPVDLLKALDHFVRFKDISKDEVIERALRQQVFRKR